MPHPAWWVTALALFFIGAWVGTRYPATNLIAKVTG